MPNNPSESQIIRVWQYQLLDRTRLVTEDGKPIEIVYPGRLNDDQGADFRGAVIASSSGLLKGDIEVHVRSSGWREHRHHRNAGYNRVILHVVMWHDTRTATHLQNGRTVPVLALHKYMKIPISQWANLEDSSTSPNMPPCLKVRRQLTTSSISGFLDRAGSERFLAKVTRFQADLAQVEASQCLYRGIMAALGYSKNKLPMLELARGLPSHILESLTKGGISDEECLARQQSRLLGTAGLLPTQRPGKPPGNRLDDPWVDELERLWASSGQAKAMSSSAWHMFKVRPNNSPVRRLVAMSYLVLRYKQEGILAAMIRIVKEIPGRQGHRLAEGLLVTADGYWANHFDFGSGSQTRSPTILGSGRAADIVVNVLLPFTFAWSQSTSQPGLGRQAFDLYRRHPRLATNSVERHMMAQLGLSGRLVNSARRQQGLLHIYNSRCTQGRCRDCRLSRV